MKAIDKLLEDTPEDAFLNQGLERVDFSNARTVDEASESLIAGLGGRAEIRKYFNDEDALSDCLDAIDAAEAIAKKLHDISVFSDTPQLQAIQGEFAEKYERDADELKDPENEFDAETAHVALQEAVADPNPKINKDKWMKAELIREIIGAFIEKVFS